MNDRTLIISDTDRRRLEALIDSARADSRVPEDYLAPLEAELGRARIVPAVMQNNAGIVGAAMSAVPADHGGRPAAVPT